MEALLVALVGVMLALLGGCLWYILSRVGSRIDLLDRRMGAMEQSLAALDTRIQHMEGQLTSLGQSVDSVLDKFTSMGERLAVVEERLEPA